MSRIFLSHSSHDNLRTLAVAQWLRDQGWEDVFLDRIPRQGIAAGDDWKARIHECMNDAAAGIFMLSPSWLESHWCQTELTLAYSLNKLIFGVLVEDLPREQIPTLLKSNWQVADLWSGRDHDSFKVIFPDETTGHTTLSRSGLLSLKEGLRRAQIDPKYFPWPPENEPDREPWRGLSPMEPQDAGIFFGRDGKIVEALDEIRRLREGNPPRLLTIVGASGAGKSSFLRAGLIPRLERDDRNYLTLPPIRPEGGALDSFAQGLCYLASKRNPIALGDIRTMVHSAVEGKDRPLLSFLIATVETHRLPDFDDAQTPTPTFILPIDQGEEFFQPSGRVQGVSFMALLALLLKQDDLNIIALVTIRSDAYESLQSEPKLRDLDQSLFNLPPISRGEYGRIITGPIEKLCASGRNLDFDPAITETLLAKFDNGLGPNALPLLSFTLNRLYRDYQTREKIDLEDYQAMGGIAGVIEAAVECALQSLKQHHGAPANRPALEVRLRRTMIPWFAGIDPNTLTAHRKLCSREQLPPESLPIAEALVEQRLLARNGETFEPAHEALLREWKELNDWLVADRELLTTLEAVRRAASDWLDHVGECADRRGEHLNHKDYLVHRGQRLKEIRDLEARPDLWKHLGKTEHKYLEACRDAEKRKLVRRQLVTLGFVFVILVGVVTTGYQAQLSLAQSEVAAQSRADALALLALSKSENDPVNALKLAIAAWPKEKDGPFPNPSVTFRAINTVLSYYRPNEVIIRHDAPVTSVASSSDGQYIVSGGGDRTIRIWNAATKEIIGEPLNSEPTDQRLPSFLFMITSVDISPNGQRIVSGNRDGNIRLWDPTVRKSPLRIMVGHESAVTSVSFSPGGHRIVSTSGDGTIRLWDAATGDSIGEPIREHQTPVYSVAYSPSGNYIVSGSQDGTIRLWDAANGNAIGEPIRGHQNAVESVVYSPDGNLIVSAGLDETVRLWDASKGNPIGEPLDHKGWLHSVAFSPDGRRIVSGSQDGIIRLWDSASGWGPSTPLLSQIDLASQVFFTPDGDHIVTGERDGTVRLWDTTAGFIIGKPMRGHEGPIVSATFSAEGDRIVSLSWEGGALLWDATTTEALGELESESKTREHLVAFLSEGDHLFSRNKEDTVRPWQSDEGWVPRTPGEWVDGMALISPDGQFVVTLAEDGTLRLWDASTGKAFAGPLLGHEGEVYTAELSPSGDRLVSGGLDGTLRLWDTKTGKTVGNPLRGHRGPIHSVNFSSDGRRIVSGSRDGTIRLWDTATGESLGRPFRGHRVVKSVAFSPDGSRIVSGGADGTVRLWDAITGSPVGQPMHGHEDSVNTVAFSPNGSLIVSGGRDGTLRLWGNLPFGNILQVACHYLPQLNGRTDFTTKGLGSEIGFENLSLPKDCENYDPPLPPEYGQ